MDKIKVIFQGKAQTRFKVRKTTARKSKRTTTKVTYKAHEIYFSMANCELCFSSKSLIHNFSHPVKIDLDKSWIPRKRLFRPSIFMPKDSEKLEMKILPHGKKELPANQCWPIC